MLLPVSPGVDAPRLSDLLTEIGSLISSLLVGAALDGAGDSALSDRLLALPGRSPAEVGVPVRSRLLLRDVPLVVVPLPTGLPASSAGVP